MNHLSMSIKIINNCSSIYSKHGLAPALVFYLSKIGIEALKTGHDDFVMVINGTTIGRHVRIRDEPISQGPTN